MTTLITKSADLDTASIRAAFAGVYAAMHEGHLAAGILSDLAANRAQASSSALGHADAATAEHAQAHLRLHQLRQAKDYAYEQLQYLQKSQRGQQLSPDSLRLRLDRFVDALALSKLVVEMLPAIDEIQARERHAFILQRLTPGLPYWSQKERMHTVDVGIHLRAEMDAYLARVQAAPAVPQWTVEYAEQWGVDKHRSIKHLRPQSDEPYEVHLGEVVELIKSVPHTRRMVAGGWLHDVIDDIPGVTRAVVAAEFDESVASLVDTLSDHEQGIGNRATRKAAERARIAAADWETQTVRVADVISNVRTIAQRNPKFASVYVPEKAALLDVLTKADPTLLALARQVVTHALAYLETHPA